MFSRTTALLTSMKALAALTSWCGLFTGSIARKDQQKFESHAPCAYLNPEGAL